jgi:zinc protease
MLRKSLLAALATSLALTGGFLAPRASAQQIKLPTIDYRHRTLANGLNVYTIEDHSAPTVSVQVWYHVGSKDDPTGRSGFAHLFEHMMFKATKNMKAETMDRLTEDVGGYNNASTFDDVTTYYELVPSNYLETLVWAEADRLASLQVEEGAFKSERDVVKEEYRQRYIASPYGRLFLAIEQKSFAAHPYKRPGIGNIDELNAATIEDVRAFHAAYYRPDNATLIIAGDFDPKQLDGWIDKYFGRIPKVTTPLPRVDVKEPARTAEQRYTVTAPNVPLPATVITYLGPAERADDVSALRIAEAILSAGESSRLYQTLVYEQQVAQDASFYTDLREDLGLLVFTAVLASGKTPAEGEKALLAELKRIQDAPVTQAELDKAKNQLVTAKLHELETAEGKAEALGRAAVVVGDPESANTDIRELMAVTPADVQRVMKKYFADTNRVVIYYVPETEPPAGGGNTK